MGPSEWYYARGETRLGPVPVTELKRLAASGALRPEDLVWRDGMPDWAFARNVKGLFDELPVPPAQTPPAATPAPPAPSPPAATRPFAANAAVSGAGQGPTPSAPWQHPFDILLGLLRQHSSERFVDTTATLATLLGHGGLAVAAMAALALTVIFSVRLTNPAYLLSGAAAIVAIVVLQYVAGRFFRALERLNRNTPSRISSTAVPDCLALLALAAGLLTLVGMLVEAIAHGAYALVPTAVLACIFCEYAACVALCLPALRITIAPEGRAGKEAIGVLSFLVKFAARLVPVAYGLGVMAAAIRLCYTVALALLPVTLTSGPDVARKVAMEESLRLFHFATLPLVAYVLFLVYHLLIDVIRALLSIKVKDDRS